MDGWMNVTDVVKKMKGYLMIMGKALHSKKSWEGGCRSL